MSFRGFFNYQVVLSAILTFFHDPHCLGTYCRYPLFNEKLLNLTEVMKHSDKLRKSLFSVYRQNPNLRAQDNILFPDDTWNHFGCKTHFHFWFHYKLGKQPHRHQSLQQYQSGQVHKFISK
jgi:hypothetical protein